MEPYIYVTSNIKLKNPCLKSDLLCYNGEIALFDQFTAPQQKNYQRIQDSLVPFGLALDQIWAGNFTGNHYGRPQKRQHFVAQSVDDIGEPIVVWQKYEGNSSGSGQNSVYVRGQKMKTTKWLTMSLVERAQALGIPDTAKPTLKPVLLPKPKLKPSLLPRPTLLPKPTVYIDKNKI